MAEEEKKHEAETPAQTPEKAAEVAGVVESSSAASTPQAAAPAAADGPTEPQLITSEKVEVTQQAKLEKKPGLFKRLFKRKQKPSAKPESEPNTQPALSQQEMSAKLAQLIDKQIAENSSGDFFVIRLRKQYFLLLLGVAIIFMWLVALGKPDVSLVKHWIKQLVPQQQAVPTPPESSTSAEVTPRALKVRIKYMQSQQNQVEAISATLASLNLAVVDAVVDPALTEKGYHFIAKSQHQALVASVAAALSPHYSLATQSAELSQDSDFDGVFIIGEAD